MIYIIVGTNRKDSVSSKAAKIAAEKFKKSNKETEIINLADLDFQGLAQAQYGQKESFPKNIRETIEKLNESEGLYIICPEYNGSMPGALKYFIDFWEYPKTFEFRPVALMGLGWRFGGLRPVEHLQQVFGYRNAFVYPERIFVQNAPKLISDEGISDSTIDELWSLQIERYCIYTKALKEANLLP